MGLGRKRGSSNLVLEKIHQTWLLHFGFWKLNDGFLKKRTVQTKW